MATAMDEPLDLDDAITDDPLEAFLARCAALRWLEPDASMDALDESARDHVRDRIAEHHAALARWMPDGFEASTRVRYTRDLVDAAARWDAAWDIPLESPYARALEAALRELDVDDARRPLVHAAGARCLATMPTARLWGYLLELVGGAALPGHRCAELHAMWLVRYRDDPTRPSPWGPLFALWERGLWPMGMPDGSFDVYVPIVASGQILLSPSSPRPEPGVPAAPTRTPWGPDPIPMRRPRAAPGVPRARGTLPDLARYGVGPGPGRDEPLPRPAPPPAGAPMPVGPMPVSVPVPPPVAPLPVTGAETDDAALPWYKRLFRG